MLYTQRSASPSSQGELAIAAGKRDTIGLYLLSMCTSDGNSPDGNIAPPQPTHPSLACVVPQPHNLTGRTTPLARLIAQFSRYLVSSFLLDGRYHCLALRNNVILCYWLRKNFPAYIPIVSLLFKHT